MTDHLGYWMRMVSNHVSFAFARRLEGKDVTVAEWVMMRELHSAEPLAPHRLAGRMGMTRGAISKLADRLVAKALVTRSDDPADGRAHMLALSDAGRLLVPDLARLADENDADAFGCLTADERTQLDRILRKIAAAHGLKGSPTS
ncbi:MarR family transcriptional regulator [Azospirillum sp. 412522]|nr:MarR family transcriptional regulator [Azospirillum sp. 412522]